MRWAQRDKTHCRKPSHSQTKQNCFIQIKDGLWRKLNALASDKKSSIMPSQPETITAENQYGCHDLSA